MDEEKIIQDLNNFKKNKDIIKDNGIDRKTLEEIMSKRYSAEELRLFKLYRTTQRTEERKEKYHERYHMDEKYREEKKKKALIYYYIRKHQFKQFEEANKNN